MISKDGEILGMSVSINAIEKYTDIPECITTEETRLKTPKDDHKLGS